MQREHTRFAVRDPRTHAEIDGEIEWGETVDIVRYHHPMTGELTENPLQGWADAPGQTAHRDLRHLLEAVERKQSPTFVAGSAGYDYVEWLLVGRTLRFVAGHLDSDHEDMVRYREAVR